MSFLTQPIYYIELSDVIKMGFTTRKGGVNEDWGFNLGYNTNEPKDEIDQNREKYYELIGQDSKHVFANQVHGNEILVVDKEGTYDGVDGFVTKERKLVLNIQTADCLAILAHDIENKVLGAFHAGWRGTKDKIVQKGIEEMLKLGADLNHVFFYINPGIKVENYEVGNELLEYFPESSFVKKEDKIYFDLVKENTRQMKEAGAKHIRANHMCTYNEKNLYSFRRDKEKAGRTLNFVVMV